MVVCNVIIYSLSPSFFIISSHLVSIDTIGGLYVVCTCNKSITKSSSSLLVNNDEKKSKIFSKLFFQILSTHPSPLLFILIYFFVNSLKVTISNNNETHSKSQLRYILFFFFLSYLILLSYLLLFLFCLPC